MSQNSRKEYLQKMRWRYAQRTGKKGKTMLIDELCEVTGYERKYAIKLLGCHRRDPNAPPGSIGRKPAYGEDVALVLKEIWLLNEQPCGKRLAPVLPVWVRSYQKRHGRLAKELEEKLLRISPAQIDRVLAPFRAISPGSRARPPRSHAALKAITPIRAQTWDVHEPGWLESDTVAHCGGSMGGSFLWSLDNVDVFSGWTEVGSVWNCGQHGVCERFGQLEGRFPFAIKGVDTDNGGEFLNWHFRAYFEGREPAVELTRSRPYFKNDQAYVEQKNYTHVRQLLGYERLEHEELVEPVNELLKVWSLWRNLYCATMKQLSSHREEGRLIRRHEKLPLTPAQRLIEHWQAQDQRAEAQAMEKLLEGHDPIGMKEEIERKLKGLATLREKLETKNQEVRARLRSAPTGPDLPKTNPPKTRTKKKPATVSTIMSQRVGY